MNKGKRQQGFTLIELVIALAVMAIVLGVGIPAFQSLSRNGERAAQVNQMVSSLHYARNEAITRNSPVTVTQQTGGWNRGWTTAADSGATILKVTSRPSTLVTITPSGYTTVVTFDGEGAAGTGGSFLYCDGDGTAAEQSRRARAVIINGVGQIRLSRDDNSNGTHEDGVGAALACS